MQFRDFISSMFGKVRNFVRVGTWKEVGAYSSIFSANNSDLYQNEIYRACIRALAEHSSKANVKCIKRVGDDKISGDKMLERMIQYRPNVYMNGKDFLYKIRTRLELDNNAFIFIQRNDFGKCEGLYPIPKASFEALESTGGEIWIRFKFPNGRMLTVPWEDLAVLRKDYNGSDVFGDSNTAIRNSISLLNTTNEGLANAIKSTANLRGILKSTKAMLDPDDVKKQKDIFVNDYLGIANEGGIASLDSTQEFTPITMQPQIANYKHTEELRNNIFRYTGVNDDILMGKASPEMLESFYEANIEGFLIALSLELTYKIYSPRSIGFGNEVIFEANRMQYISMQNKLNLVQMVDRGAMTPNEWRQVMNLGPLEGGDLPIRRLDTAQVTEGREDDN